MPGLQKAGSGESGARCPMAFAVSSTAFTSDLLPNPIAWFKAENASGNTVTDASGNGRNLTLGSGVSTVENLGVKALAFNGTTNAWATFSMPAVTNSTVSFWQYRELQDASIKNESDAEQNVYPYFIAGYSGMIFQWTKDVQQQIAFIYSANSSQNKLTFNSKRGEWHHFAATVECTGTDPSTGREILRCICYMDGVGVVTNSWTNDQDMRTGTQTVTIGNLAQGWVRPLSGMVADMRFFNTTLTAEQVVLMAAEGGSGKTLLLRYPFDEISGNTTPEATGNGPAMTLGTEMALSDDGVDGKALACYGTGGVWGYAAKCNSSRLLAEHTITCWVKRSSRAHEYDAVVDNPFPRLYTGFGTSQCSDLATNGRAFNVGPIKMGTTSTTGSNYAFADVDTWSHLAVVLRLVGDGANAGKGIIDLYVNGEPVSSYSRHDVFDLDNMLIQPEGGNIILANTGSNGSSNRFFCGDIDDLRVYSGALSADEVRRVYRGLAAISAGEDFTVAGETAVLAGTVAPDAQNGLRKGYAGVTEWSLVSAPAGGESARIECPAASATRATLPVAGEYVFRLTISDMGVSASDDVTVTRVAPAVGNAAPTVSLASVATATLPGFASLSASVSDDGNPAPAATRVFWSKKSGPGGVWFEPPNAAATKAYFSAVGSYVLTCTADDGQATASADVTVTVADERDGKNLDTDLLHYWSLDGQVDPYFKDTVSPTTSFTAPDYVKLRYLPGKVGYGARAYAHSGAGAYFDTAVQTGEKSTTGTTANNDVPSNDYLTVSAWIYIDPADTNEICGASAVGQSHAFGIRYCEKWTYADDVNNGGFSLYQNGPSGAASMAHYPVPSPNPVGRWMHICGVFRRNAENISQWEMWYDGVKQTASWTSPANGCKGRIWGTKVMIGGLNYTAATASGGDKNTNWSKDGTAANYYSRTFPGIVDEVRMWKRKLTEGEIRYLAANPSISENRAPSVDTIASENSVFEKGRAEAISSAAADDGRPNGTLSSEWIVVSGNAAAVSFSDASATSTTVTVSEKGSYTFVLKSTDGERVTYGPPRTIDVQGPGMFLIFR